eukprot:scaffold28282_cov74-Phaeocystis_antarctica.AAC.4
MRRAERAARQWSQSDVVAVLCQHRELLDDGHLPVQVGFITHIQLERKEDGIHRPFLHVSRVRHRDRFACPSRAPRRRVVARLGRCALHFAAQTSLVRVGSARARRRGTGPLIRAVDAQALVGAGQAAGSLTVGLVLPWLAQLTRAQVDIGCHRAQAAGRLLDTACRRVETSLGRRALAGAGEVSGGRVESLAARQRRRRALRAVRAGLAGDARLLALAGLVLAGDASVAEGSARGVRNEAGRAVSAVSWVGAPRNRVGLPRSARLARRAAILAAVWVERAGAARRERLPQARRSFCRTRAAAWTIAALARLDALAQLARRARGAAGASLVRVVAPGCTRNTICLREADDPDGQGCAGRTA